MRHFVQFIPIATTILALTFSVVLFRRWGQRGGPHLLWFAVGALTYAAGTITESWTTLFGWNDAVFRAWYITGALMGGAPLAQGSVYLPAVSAPFRVCEACAFLRPSLCG
ncbi:hypothetical protein BH09GEM1_BH09GEM1_11250 [soil metagenome]